MSSDPRRRSRGPESAHPHRASRPPLATRQRDIALIDLLDRLLDGGVVLAGDITLAVADVDLVYVGLRALVSSVAAAERQGVPLPR
jgi:Gas vesicle protein